MPLVLFEETVPGPLFAWRQAHHHSHVNGGPVTDREVAFAAMDLDQRIREAGLEPQEALSPAEAALLAADIAAEMARQDHEWALMGDYDRAFYEYRDVRDPYGDSDCFDLRSDLFKALRLNS